MSINKRHGGPFDRGSADAYYGRPACPHYYKGATKASPKNLEQEMTQAQIDEYFLGYDEQVESGEFKY